MATERRKRSAHNLPGVKNVETAVFAEAPSVSLYLTISVPPSLARSCSCDRRISARLYVYTPHLLSDFLHILRLCLALSVFEVRWCVNDLRTLNKLFQILFLCAFTRRRLWESIISYPILHNFKPTLRLLLQLLLFLLFVLCSSSSRQGTLLMPAHQLLCTCNCACTMRPTQNGCSPFLNRVLLCELVMISPPLLQLFLTISCGQLP